MAEYGRTLQNQEFLLQPGGIFLNQGSYGTTPRKVQDERLRLLAEAEAQPDVFFRRSRHQHYDVNIRAAAAFVGADPSNLVFMKNTTSGINTVVKNLTLTSQDAILTHSWTYGAVKNIMNAVAARTGCEVLRVDMRIPIISKQEIVDKYREMLDRHKNIQFAIIDHISSVPPVVFPVKELTSLCKARGVKVMVDGAHTPGQLPLKLEEVSRDWDFDFFVGNLHKWAFAPRGCAVLWVKPDFHHVMRPLITSQALDEFQKDHHYQGTDDFSTFYCAKAAVEFYQEMGGMERISSYNRDLVTQAADMLVKKWGTRHFPIPEDMEAPFMRMVQLPRLKRFPAVEEKEGDIKTLYGDIHELTAYMWDRFAIQSLFLYVQDDPWVRLSAHIYNSMDDYGRLADAILTLCDEETVK